MGRAAAGESTIYKDAAGRWHGYVSMGQKDNGARDRRHVSAQRRAAVVARVRALEQKRDAGTAVGGTRAVTVAAWLDHYLQNIAARKVRPSTLTRYRQLVTNQLVPKLGHHRLDRLQPEHLDQAYGELLDTGLSPTSVLQAHRVLSRALKVAMQRDKITRNVATLVDPPSAARTEVQPLTAEEARRVLAKAADQRNGARWSVALALGLRQDEALGLRWDAVDLEAGRLTVRTALQRQAGAGLVLVEPKSRAGRRTLALPAQLREALTQHRDAQLAERRLASELWVDLDLVFAQPNGRALDPRGDHRAWRALLASAAVRQARLHDARHTAATMLLSQGVPARVVMEILGHSQITLTLGTYSHVAVEVAQNAAKRMGDVL